MKRYEEDLDKKEELERKAAEPVVIIKDKFGRVMEKKHPLLEDDMRVPSKNRLPVKRPPPQRKLSFTEA